MHQSGVEIPHKPAAAWGQWLCCAVAALCAWGMFLAFESVLQQHVRKAQHISQAASWAGQPVGTMAQWGVQEGSPSATTPSVLASNQP